MRQTLKTSGNAATTLNTAATVFVYDYCFLMKALAEENAAQHWWAKDHYNKSGDVGLTLLQLYRWVFSCAMGSSMQESVLLKSQTSIISVPQTSGESTLLLPSNGLLNSKIA